MPINYEALGSLDPGSIVDFQHCHENREPDYEFSGLMSTDRHVIIDPDSEPDSFGEVIDGGGSINYGKQVNEDRSYNVNVNYPRSMLPPWAQ